MNATQTTRLLCRLADGQAADDLAPDGRLSATDATRWFQANKHPLVAVAQCAPAWLRADAFFQQQLAVEEEWFATQRQEYGIVREAWLARGIDCMMVKSAGNLPSFPYASDNIDIEVLPENGRTARETLRQLGYVDVRSVEERRKFLFRKFRAGRCVSAIHVHECVGWDVGFMDEATLWARKRRSADDPQVNIPAPEDALLINLAHACYENKRLRLVDIARVRHVLRCSGEALDWADMERVAASRGWLDGLAFLVLVYASLEPDLFGSSLVPPAQQARFQKVVDQVEPIRTMLAAIQARRNVDLPMLLPYWFCKRLHYRKILTDPALSVRRRVFDAYISLAWGIKLKARLRPQHGAIISVSGPDGAGKTAHTQALVEALRLCEVQTASVWNRGGSTGLAALARPFSRHIAAPPPAAVSNNGVDSLTSRRRRLASASPLVRVGWSWLVALDQVAFYNVRARVPTMIGQVVVLDRYAFDSAVEMDLSLPEHDRWSRLAIKAMLKLVPRPRQGFVLDVSLPTARARKPDEVWQVDFEAARQRYHALAREFGLQLVSTEGSFADTNDAWLRDVIMAYMEDFETWLNGVFRANPSQLNIPDPVWAQRGVR